MGALDRLQAYFKAQMNARTWSFPEWANQFPIDILGMVPGLTQGTASTVVAPTWSAFTTYTVDQKVSWLGFTYISIQGSNLNRVPNTSPAYWVITNPDHYPSASGSTNGELYLTNNISPPEVFFWFNGSWYLLSTGGSSGTGYILPPASGTLLGGVYAASALLGNPATPTVMILQPAVGPVSQYFDAASARVSNVLDPILSQDAATKNYVDVTVAALPVLSEPDAFTAGLYRTTTGGTPAFPTTITWWADAGHTIKVKEISLTYDPSFNITQEVYRFYNAGVLVRTYTDVITLSGPFETSRNRTIT